MAATSANVRSRPGEALTASPVKGGAAQFGLHKKRYTDSGTRWQVVAFRAVRDGDLKVMRELAFEQPGDDARVRQAAGLIHRSHAIDDLHRATGYSPARLTSVTLRGGP